MWPTPAGERILQGAEAVLFKEGLGTLVDFIHDDTEDLWPSGVEPFDHLQRNQKLAVLAQIGSALLCEELIDSLAGEILWDEDWRQAEIQMDVSPEQGQAMKKLLGIDEDYYVAVSPDPSEEELEGILALLKKLTKVVSAPKDP